MSQLLHQLLSHVHVYNALLLTTGLFNLRGSDIEYNPVFFSYAIITMKDVRYTHVCMYSITSLVRPVRESNVLPDNLC